jgi:hypothetical protein
VAIVRATNHVECPPKERHLRSAWIPPTRARLASYIFSTAIFFFASFSASPFAVLIDRLCCRDCGGDVHREATGGRRLLHPRAFAPPCQDTELDCKHCPTLWSTLFVLVLLWIVWTHSDGPKLFWVWGY